MSRSSSQAPRYGPADSSLTPRFSGPRTFMRLPLVESFEDVDAAVIGVPTDDAVSFRSGARFGPAWLAVAAATVLSDRISFVLPRETAAAAPFGSRHGCPTIV